MSKAVFLDRDGVINRVIMREGKVCSPRTIEEFEWEAGVHEAVAALRGGGLKVIVVTNQPDIARRKMHRLTLEAMSERIYRDLSVDSVFVCPHDEADNCGCRKPKPGMLLNAATILGLDFTRSFMVGDTWKDMEAGRAAGCRTVLLRRPYNTSAVGDFEAGSLIEAVDLILGFEEAEKFGVRS